MDNWKLIVPSDTINCAVEQIAERIDNEYSDKDLVLVCVLKGAVYFMTDLSRKLKTRHSIYFIDASSYDGQKRKEVFIANSLIPEKFSGKTVIIVDELLDSGHTLLNIKDAFLKFMDPSDIITCVAMNKILRKKKVFEADIVGLNVPDVWLVGYGLDDNGYSRQLIDVWGVPKIDESDKTEDDIKIFGH